MLQIKNNFINKGGKLTQKWYIYIYNKSYALKKMLDNSQKEALIITNDELIKDDNNSKVPHLNDINELVKYFPDFKECKTLQLMLEEYDPVCISKYYSQKDEELEINSIKKLLEILGWLAGFSVFFFPVAIIAGLAFGCSVTFNLPIDQKARICYKWSLHGNEIYFCFV